MSDTDDEEMKRVKALSLAEYHNSLLTSAQQDNEEDYDAQYREDIEAATKASLAGTPQKNGESSILNTSAPSSELPKPLPQTQRMSTFLDSREERIQLEKERLERQRKRLREESERGGGKGKEKSTGYGDESIHHQIEPTAKKARVETAAQETNIGSSTHSERFWDGAIRQTANRHVDTKKDTRPIIRLSDIIAPKEEIAFAIMASYANMPEFMFSFFEENTPVISVVQPDESGNSRVINLTKNYLLTTPFLRLGRGCQHIKLILPHAEAVKLIYKDGRLRIAVPTANFVDYDWRDIENTVWVQDIPKRQTPIRHDAKATDFPSTLARVLHSLNVPAAMNKLLNADIDLPIEALHELRMRWDWSKVTAKLVASIAGKHEGWESVNRSGHPALAIALKELGAKPGRDRDVVLECQGSSIGAYSTQWMNEFYCSARGESAREWIDKPKTTRAKLPWPQIKIIFPSLQTVKNSILGPGGGGTIFCKTKQWEAAKFPRELFHDSKSRRGGVLMHTKMILALFQPKQSQASSSRYSRPHSEDEDTDEERECNRASGSSKGGDTDVDKSLAGWLYVGSHNFTPSAWGTLSGSSTKPSLNNVNYEMGVVVPFKTLKDAEDIVCWERPARKYVLSKDRPWIQDENLSRS